MAPCRQKEWILESLRPEFKSQLWPLGAVGNRAHHGLSQSLCLASSRMLITTRLLEACGGPERGQGPTGADCVAGGAWQIGSLNTGPGGGLPVATPTRRRMLPLVRAGLDVVLP